MKKIGSMIREYRIKQNMTEEELGAALCVDARTVSDWEKGRRIPDSELLRRLSAALEIPCDVLLFGTVQEMRRLRRAFIAVISALLCVAVIFAAAAVLVPCVKAIQYQRYLALIELGFGSKDLPNPANQYATDTTMVQLLSNPEKYHGKLVRVIGVGNIEFEGHSLSLSKEDLKYGLGHEIWIKLGERAIPVEEAIKYNGEYVIVEGFFDMYDTGHMGMFQGAIKNINRYQLWTFEHTVGTEYFPQESGLTSETE